VDTSSGAHRISRGIAKPEPGAALESLRRAGVWGSETLYNFRVLHQYKDKFNPQWQARYLATPGGLVLPRVLKDLTVLIAGGLRGVIGK